MHRSVDEEVSCLFGEGCGGSGGGLPADDVVADFLLPHPLLVVELSCSLYLYRRYLYSCYYCAMTWPHYDLIC